MAGEVASEVISDGRSLRAQRLRNERRLQILEVARQLFAQRGYHATSIQDLLDRADIARGTFYLHFDSKRAIFDELVDEFLARIRSVVRVVDLSPTAPPPLLQIESNLDRIFLCCSRTATSRASPCSWPKGSMPSVTPRWPTSTVACSIFFATLCG